MISEYDLGYTQATRDMMNAIYARLPEFVDSIEWVDDVDAAYAEFVREVEKEAAEERGDGRY